MPDQELIVYVTGERFRWEATDRTTGTVYSEDMRGLGSFTQLNTHNLSKLRLFQPVGNGEIQIELDIPEGAEAIFRRRRTIILHRAPEVATANMPKVNLGWTIIGWQWPDGKGFYHFFNDVTDEHLETENFNIV